MKDDETIFDQFWQASSLDRFNIQQFASALSGYDSDDKELHLAFPLESEPLPKPRTALGKIAKQRKSNRVFSGKPLSLKELGMVLEAFYAWNGLEHRSYPSAGATYVTEIFCVPFAVEKYTGKVLYYDAEKHGVVVINDDAPSWVRAAKTLNMNVDGTPQLVVLFVIFPERAIAKYGERGGRFALLETGAALQQLALHITESSKLKGVVVGGVLDGEWTRILRLEHTDARIAAGYLVGK